jgi:hypothetical protein
MKIHCAVRLLVFGLFLLVIPAALDSQSSAQIAVGISVRIGPPALPVYEQPICPSPGYLWTPGYWAWDDGDGYYWVPGTWVEAPQPGLLWTPGYWGWNDGVYAWHVGYWGPHIGFYGGVNYGFGYGGVGFGGGEWRGGRFFYNTAVMHVDTVHITNVYVNRTVIVNNSSHVAFNGGQGGIVARPTAAEQAAAREPHRAPVAAQVRQQHAASQNRAMFASANHGAPAVAATPRPGKFSGHGIVRAKAAGAPYHAPKMSPREARAAAPAHHTTASNRGNAGNHPSAKPSHPASTPHVANSHAVTAARPNNSQPKSTAHLQNAARTQNSRPQGAHLQNASHSQSATHAENTHPQGTPKAKSSAAPAPSAPKVKPATTPASRPSAPQESKKK